MGAVTVAGVPPFGLERLADHLRVGRAQALARGGHVAAQQAVAPADLLAGERAHRQQLLADVRQGPPVGGHLDRVAGRAVGLRGQRRVRDADRDLVDAARRVDLPDARVDVAVAQRVDAVDSFCARPSQKLRKLKMVLIMVGVLRGSTFRTFTPLTLKIGSGVEIPASVAFPTITFVKAKGRTPWEDTTSLVSNRTAEF